MTKTGQNFRIGQGSVNMCREKTTLAADKGSVHDELEVHESCPCHPAVADIARPGRALNVHQNLGTPNIDQCILC